MLTQEFKERWLNRLIWMILIVVGSIVVQKYSGCWGYVLEGIDKMAGDKQKVEKLIK